MKYSLRQEMVELFFEFINERHLIYVKRQRDAPWPWTKDEVLQEYKFTNIFRELDTGTVWYRENIREPYADHEKLFFNTVLYRAFNYWPTAKFIGFVVNQEEFNAISDAYHEGIISAAEYDKHAPWDPDGIEEDLRWLSTKHEMKIFTSAHMVSGTLGGPERKDKIWQVVHAVCDHMWKNEEKYIPQKGDTLQKAFERLKKAPGHGPFIAYEVITDLRHTRSLQDAEDSMTWANPGPGALRGINRIHNLPVGREDNPLLKKPKYHPMKYKGIDYIGFMRFLLAVSYDGLKGEKYKASFVPQMEMRDIEHSLCEFDKYMRVKTGQGRPRQKFVPPHER